MQQATLRVGQTRDHVVEFGSDRVERGRNRGLDGAQLEREGDELLLGAVVQVPFDPAPLRVARGDDARPGRGNLGELAFELGPEPLVVGGEPDWADTVDVKKTPTVNIAAAIASRRAMVRVMWPTSADLPRMEFARCTWFILTP